MYAAYCRDVFIIVVFLVVSAAHFFPNELVVVFSSQCHGTHENGRACSGGLLFVSRILGSNLVCVGVRCVLKIMCKYVV